MEKEVVYYNQDGTIKSKELLTNESLKGINGMMTRCTMKDRSVQIGLADSFRICEGQECFDNKVHDYIYLETWDNLDEETHQLVGEGSEKYNTSSNKVLISDVVKVEAILYSNPRWGGILTNKFKFNTK